MVRRTGDSSTHFHGQLTTRWSAGRDALRRFVVGDGARRQAVVIKYGEPLRKHSRCSRFSFSMMP
jgi:hypothetical protein